MTEPGGTFGLFLPLILMTLPFVFLNGFIANRKGKNVILFVIFSFIPLVAFYLAIYLIPLTDASVLQKLDKISSQLENP